MKKILPAPTQPGALGARLLNKVHHLMRRDDAIPQVALTASVMDAMLELSRTGLGAGGGM